MVSKGEVVDVRRWSGTRGAAAEERQQREREGVVGRRPVGGSVHSCGSRTGRVFTFGVLCWERMQHERAQGQRVLGRGVPGRCALIGGSPWP